MSAVSKIHTENGIARLYKGKIYGKICLSAGMGLYVYVIRTE